MQVSDGIAIVFTFVLSIAQASSWQHLQQHRIRLSNASSNRAAVIESIYFELLTDQSQQLRSVWSEYHQFLNKIHDNELYNDDYNQRVASMSLHFAQGHRTILFTITMLICLCCVHPEVSIASVDPIHNLQCNIYLTSAETPPINHEPQPIFLWCLPFSSLGRDVLRPGECTPLGEGEREQHLSIYYLLVN